MTGGGRPRSTRGVQSSAVTYSAVDSYIEIFEGRGGQNGGYECRQWLDPSYMDQVIGPITLEAFAIAPSMDIGSLSLRHRTPRSDSDSWTPIEMLVTPNPIAYTPTLGAMMGGPPLLGSPASTPRRRPTSRFAAYTSQPE